MLSRATPTRPAAPALAPTAIAVIVRYANGTYTTSTVHGLRASSTQDEQAAVQRLAERLANTGRIQQPVVRIELARSLERPGTTHWRIEGLAPVRTTTAIAAA